MPRAGTQPGIGSGFNRGASFAPRSIAPGSSLGNAGRMPGRVGTELGGGRNLNNSIGFGNRNPALGQFNGMNRGNLGANPYASPNLGRANLGRRDLVLATRLWPIAKVGCTATGMAITPATRPGTVITTAWGATGSTAMAAMDASAMAATGPTMVGSVLVATAFMAGGSVVLVWDSVSGWAWAVLVMAWVVLAMAATAAMADMGVMEATVAGVIPAMAMAAMASVASGLGMTGGWGLNSWGYGPGLYDWGYSTYDNPYYTSASGTGEPTMIDYSQPINPTAAPPAESVTEQATSLFEQARTDFKNGDYTGSLDLINQALKQLPNDPALHEFRALVLFALARYDEAAASLYSVLSVEPGWDWTTMIGLYPDVDIYTRQLRALESYASQSPRSASARFVLAYHYLTQGHTEAAVAELKLVQQLQPKDALSAQLLQQLEGAHEPTSASVAATAASPSPAITHAETSARQHGLGTSSECQEPHRHLDRRRRVRDLDHRHVP